MGQEKLAPKTYFYENEGVEMKRLIRRYNQCKSRSDKLGVECILPIGHDGAHRSVTMNCLSLGRGYYFWNDAIAGEAWKVLDENPNTAT